MKKTLLILACFAILSCSVAQAQTNTPPSGQFGLGILAGGSGGPSGLEGIFAINQNMQVGTLFGLQINSGGGVSTTTLAFAPFFRYQFVKAVSPFLQGGLAIASSGSTTSSGLFIGGGLAYYIAATFGIHADIDLFAVAFSPSGLSFGWGNGRVGADWYF